MTPLQLSRFKWHLFADLLTDMDGAPIRRLWMDDDTRLYLIGPLIVSISTDACPLCAKYCLADCEGCPVSEHSGFDMCTGTPWDDVFQYLQRREWVPDSTDLMRACVGPGLRLAVIREAAFLDSLEDPDEE